MTSALAPGGTAGIRREVVSFARRGRMSSRRRRLWQDHHATWVVDLPRGDYRTSLARGVVLDPPVIFGRTVPLVVEVGCGDGESLVPMAERRPGGDVLAFEVYQPAVASVLARLAASGIGNVRIVEVDAVAGLRALPPASVNELWVFFPDPWPKARHAKRRLVNRGFADLVANRLRPGGVWRLATDDAGYAAQARAHLHGHPAFRVERATRGDRPVTKFERRAQAAGRPVSELAFSRA